MKTYHVDFNVQVSGKIAVAAESFKQAAENVRTNAKEDLSALMFETTINDWNNLLISGVFLEEASAPEGVGCRSIWHTDAANFLGAMV